MNCRKVNSLLSAYMDSELPGVEQLQIRRHLSECSCCNAEYESLLFTKRLISGLRMQAPRSGLEQRICAAVNSKGEQRARRIDFRGWWMFLDEPQRGKVRLSALCATLAAVTWLYAAMPSPGSGHSTAMLPAADVPAVGTSASYLEPPLPVRDYLSVQHSWDNAQPMSSPNVVPIGSRIELDTSR